MDDNIVEFNESLMISIDQVTGNIFTQVLQPNSTLIEITNYDGTSCTKLLCYVKLVRHLLQKLM